MLCYFLGGKSHFDHPTRISRIDTVGQCAFCDDTSGTYDASPSYRYTLQYNNSGSDPYVIFYDNVLITAFGLFMYVTYKLTYLIDLMITRYYINVRAE